MRILLILIGLLGGALEVRAQENLDFIIHQPYVTPRSLGAGGSFSVIDDYNTLLYNPAGLYRLQEGELNFGFTGAITPNALGFTKEVEDAKKAETEAEKINKMVDVIEKNYGKTYGTRLPILNAIWARPKWGIGIILADSTINLGVHQAIGPAVSVSAYVDNTIAFGISKGYLEEDALTVGATIKAMYRGFVGRMIPALDLVQDPKFFKAKDAKEGMTVDADLGLQYKLKPPESGFFSFLSLAKPTFAFVVRNAVDYGFKQNMHLIDKDSGNDPPNLGRRIDVGSKWELPSFWVFSPKFMLDERDIGHKYFTFMKGLHTGFELGWNAFSWLQGYYSVGLGQGYISGGIGAQLAWFRLDAATYGEEVGTSKKRVENRYYIAKMSLDF